MRNLATPLALLLLLLPLALFVRSARASPDVDGDGRITLADLKGLSVDLNTLAAAWKGDVNGDGRVDQEDVRELARILIRRGAPALEPTEQLIEALVRHAVSGGGTGDVLEVLRGLERAPGEPGGGGGGGVRGAFGRPAKFGENLSRYYAGMRAEPGEPAPPPSYAVLSARRARPFGGPLGNRQVGEAFDAYVAAHPAGEDLSCGDPPDPGALGDAARRARTSPLLVARDGDERSRVLPRGAVALVLNPDDPTAVSLRATVRGGGGTLDDEFRRVSGLADLADATRALVDPARRDLPDPLLSQFIADLADPEEFLKSADRDRDRTVTLDEFLTLLLSPETARRVMLGDPGALGLMPDSAIVRNYAAIVNAAIPSLLASGLLGGDAASATLAAVNGTAIASAGPDDNASAAPGEGGAAEPGGSLREGAAAKPAAKPGSATARGERRPGSPAVPSGKPEAPPPAETDSANAAAKLKIASLTAQVKKAQAEVTSLKKEIASLKATIAGYEAKVNGAHSIAEATHYSNLWQAAKDEHSSKVRSLSLTSQAVANYQSQITRLKKSLADPARTGAR